MTPVLPPTSGSGVTPSKPCLCFYFFHTGLYSETFISFFFFFSKRCLIVRVSLRQAISVSLSCYFHWLIEMPVNCNNGVKFSSGYTRQPPAQKFNSYILIRRKTTSAVLQRLHAHTRPPQPPRRCSLATRAPQVKSALQQGAAIDGLRALRPKHGEDFQAGGSADPYRIAGPHTHNRSLLPLHHFFNFCIH